MSDDEARVWIRFAETPDPPGDVTGVQELFAFTSQPSDGSPEDPEAFLLEDFVEHELAELQESGFDVLYVDGTPHGLSVRGAYHVVKATGDMSWGVIREDDLLGEVGRRVMNTIAPDPTDDSIRITWPVGQGVITIHGPNLQAVFDSGRDVASVALPGWSGSVRVYMPIGMEGGGDSAAPLMAVGEGGLQVYVVDPEVVNRVVYECERRGTLWCDFEGEWIATPPPEPQADIHNPGCGCELDHDISGGHFLKLGRVLQTL